MGMAIKRTVVVMAFESLQRDRPSSSVSLSPSDGLIFRVFPNLCASEINDCPQALVNHQQYFTVVRILSLIVTISHPVTRTHTQKHTHALSAQLKFPVEPVSCLVEAINWAHCYSTDVTAL